MHRHLGEPRGQFRADSPVGGGPPVGQQPGLRQQERSAAHRSDAPGIAADATDLGDQTGRKPVGDRRSGAGDDKSVDRGADRRQGEPDAHRYSEVGVHRLPVQRRQVDVVAARPVQDLQRPRDIEQHHAVVHRYDHLTPTVVIHGDSVTAGEQVHHDH